jgi:hypothetical protein
LFTLILRERIYEEKRKLSSNWCKKLHFRTGVCTVYCNWAGGTERRGEERRRGGYTHIPGPQSDQKKDTPPEA